MQVLNNFLEWNQILGVSFSGSYLFVAKCRCKPWDQIKSTFLIK